MKKISILMLGIIIGTALAITTSVYAADIQSLIGKTIQGEFPIKIEGKELSKKALVIDGTSYVPLRVFGEAIGYESSFDAELGITFKVSEVKKMANQQSVEESKMQAKAEEDQMNAKTAKKNVKYNEIGQVQGKININNNLIKSKQESIDQINVLIDKRIANKTDASDAEKERINEGVKQLESEVQGYKDDITTLQAQIPDLQKQIDVIQKEIDDLDTQLVPTSTP